MSYHITYNPELDKRYPPLAASKSKSKLITILGILAVIVIIFALTHGKLAYYLIPGEPELTAQAFSALLENVTNGKPMNESLLTFCKEIIIHTS